MCDIDYLICLDFEATCWENSSQHEIIEFPSVVVDVKNRKIIDRIEQFVRPKNNVILSEFCKNLTHITQEQVNNGITFKQAFTNHFNFVQKYPNHIFVTCGDWDLLTMLPSDCFENKVKISKTYKEWINIKHPFKHMYKMYNGASMDKMLKRLNMTFEGSPHRGIDDAHNLARICIKMMEDGYVFPRQK